MTRRGPVRTVLGSVRAGAVVTALAVAAVGLGSCSSASSPGARADAAAEAPADLVSDPASSSTTPATGSSSTSPGHRSPDRPPVPGRRSGGSGEPTVGPHHEQTDVLRRLPGRGDGGCVAVGDHRDVRSGGLAAGPFDSARAGYSPAYGDAQVIRLYLVPEHAARMSGLTVTARREGGGEVVRQRQEQTADADLFRFYDVDLAIPRAGTWVIRAVAGQDRGCWTVDLG